MEEHSKRSASAVIVLEVRKVLEQLGIPAAKCPSELLLSLAERNDGARP